MKLLHVIPYLEIGGAPRLLSDLLPIQKKQGLDVDILVNIRKDNDLSRRIQNSGVNIISLEEPNIYRLSNVLHIRKIIKQYDIIHVHLFPSIYWVALASIGLNKKLVFTEHSTSNRRRTKKYLCPIEKLIYKQYQKIISISDQTQDALQLWLNATDKRFIVINNGINLEQFNSIKTSDNSRNLIMISRFAPSKDQETLIRAMKYVDSDVILRLVGDGENIQHCKDVAYKEGVIDRVEFLGTRTDIVELIAKSYIGIQSSNWEGFGLSAVELMASGKPVICSDVPGLANIVGETNLLFKRGDYIMLSNKINYLLDNQEVYNQYSKYCRCEAQQYSIYEMAKQYYQIYLTVFD